jgi:predicted RND superfamily exporter protein
MSNRLHATLAQRSRCLIVALFLLALLAPGILRLRIDSTTDSMFPRGGEVFDWAHDFSANFITETPLIVVVRAENIFEPKTMRQLQGFADGLERLEVVARAEHLFSVKFPQKGLDGFRIEPLLEALPENNEESEKLRNEALANPLLGGSLFNRDGTAAAFYPVLETNLDQPNLQRYAVEQIGAYVASARQHGMDAYFAGGPVIAESVVDHIWRNLRLLGPLGIIVVASLILYFFKSRNALLFYLCTSSSSAVATFGFMGWFGIEITPFVSVVMIVVVVVGCAEDIHLVAEYRLLRRHGVPQAKAVRALFGTAYKALFLTSSSTALGFYMAAVSDVPALKAFAITCGTGILLNFLFTALFAPLFLSGDGGRNSTKRIRALHGALFRFVVWTSTQRPLQTSVAVIALCCVSVLGVFRISVDNDFLHFFKEEAPIVQDLRKLDVDFGGRSSVVVVVETHWRQGIWKPDAVNQIAAFQSLLEESFDHVSGFPVYLREFLYLTGEGPRRLGGSLEAGGDQIQLFRQFYGRRLLGRYTDHDGARTAIWIRSGISGSSDVRKAKAVISAAAASVLPGGWEIRVLGEPVETAAVADSITSEMMSSLVLLATTVSIVLVIYFRSWALGLLALVPNVLPVVATFGFMGWFGIPLGTGVFAVAMAAFGIAVNDTVHLFVRFSQEAKQAPSRGCEQLLRRTLATVMFPNLVTSITMIAGFAVFLVSDFRVHQETGLLFVVAIGTALLTDLFVTPLILSGVHFQQRDRNSKKADVPSVDRGREGS